MQFQHNAQFDIPSNNYIQFLPAVMRARARRQVTNGTQFRWLPSFYRSPPCPLLSSELSARYSRSFALACYTEPVSVIKIGVFPLQVTAEKLHISPCWSDQANVLMGGIDHMVR